MIGFGSLDRGPTIWGVDISVDVDPSDGSINLYLRSTRKGGGHFKPKRLVAFRAKLAAAWRQAGPPIKGPVELSIELYYPRQSHAEGCKGVAFGDVDSPLKAIVDSLMDAKVIDDDVQVVRVTSSKFHDAKRPRVVAHLASTATGA